MLLDIDCAASSCHLKILQIAVKKGNNINAWILHHSESERRPQTLKVQSNVEHEVIFFSFTVKTNMNFKFFITQTQKSIALIGYTVYY